MVNPIAKKRFEDQRNTYIAEDRKLRDLGEKRKTEEKEREEFVKGLAEEMPMKMVTEPMSSVTKPGEGELFEEIKDFAGIGDEKDEKWEQEFISGFKENEGIEVKEEKKPKTTNQKNIVKNQRGNTIMAGYESGDKWLMSEGEDDLAKAVVNNVRSTMGEAVEDLAFALKDIAPWHKPSEKVLEDRTAGKIGDMAEKQFENAKEKTGDFGDSMIDLADNASEMLGYSVFGSKATIYTFVLAKTLDEYRRLRENGASKKIAAREAATKGISIYLEEKLEDYIGKAFRFNNNNEIYWGNDIVDKADDIEYNRANEIGDLVNGYHDVLSDAEWARFYSDVAKMGKLDAKIGDKIVWGENGIIILAEKVEIGRGKSDYQVVDYWLTENAHEKAYSIQKRIEKGGYYDSERIEREINKFSNINDGHEVRSKYD